MASVTFTIPDEKVPRVREAMLGMYPIPFWVNPATEEYEPQFTENQWMKERVRQFIRDTVHQWEVRQAKIAAQGSVPVDDEIAT